ncbi:hypothetical protein SEETMRM10961_15365 [Salmonella enterica subsp. enterica serovar Typhimurium]|nr:hypothetical protein SEETMRM10961_15365 [Salmonella enterica subsp. enterica serovar Typhimurium]
MNSWSHFQIKKAF